LDEHRVGGLLTTSPLLQQLKHGDLKASPGDEDSMAECPVCLRERSRLAVREALDTAFGRVLDDALSSSVLHSSLSDEGAASPHNPDSPRALGAKASRAAPAEDPQQRRLPDFLYLPSVGTWAGEPKPTPLEKPAANAARFEAMHSDSDGFEDDGEDDARVIERRPVAGAYAGAQAARPHAAAGPAAADAQPALAAPGDEDEEARIEREFEEYDDDDGIATSAPTTLRTLLPEQAAEMRRRSSRDDDAQQEDDYEDEFEQ